MIHPPPATGPYYPLADVKAAARAKRIYLDRPVADDMAKHTVPRSKLLDAIEALTEKDFHKTHHYTDKKNPVRDGYFDAYQIRRSQVSLSGIKLLKDDDYLKIKLTNPPSGDLVVVISYHPSGH